MNKEIYIEKSRQAIKLFTKDVSNKKDRLSTCHVWDGDKSIFIAFTRDVSPFEMGCATKNFAEKHGAAVLIFESWACETDTSKNIDMSIPVQERPDTYDCIIGILRLRGGRAITFIQRLSKDLQPNGEIRVHIEGEFSGKMF